MGHGPYCYNCMNHIALCDCPPGTGFRSQSPEPPKPKKKKEKK